MSNVVNFLERLGRDAELRNAEKSELLVALADAKIAPQMWDAILAGDRAGLEVLLGCRANMCCGVFPGKEDEDESEEEPSKDDDEIFARGLVRNVA